MSVKDSYRNLAYKTLTAFLWHDAVVLGNGAPIDNSSRVDVDTVERDDDVIGGRFASENNHDNATASSTPTSSSSSLGRAGTTVEWLVKTDDDMEVKWDDFLEGVETRAAAAAEDASESMDDSDSHHYVHREMKVVALIRLVLMLWPLHC